MELSGALIVLGLLLLLLAVVLAMFWSRQTTLSRRVGSFSCGLRPDTSSDRPWTTGIAHYTSSRLVWWRVLSLSPRPAAAWSRDELTLVERVPLGEVDERGRQMLLVRCVHGSDAFQVLMSAPACAGLVSWLESGPRPVGRVI
ncbi:hypothetical protein N866_19900 [Actinotalea ferrariae CF5-4]|uniref:DUF2550 domain-containing protein n=1 Tax=Actinotalea ferrariae CF5-4 TaxID=948458 RepID=A0A021VU27_9CELL|nr:DUF2550 family protein [Actinotalea ferrariae]EYR63545.1 hypothetical protein N866_19900 [Actinotalea ferrariae CF5-4]